ncbi:uncharacterized protein A4U43_C04F21650 [Asparagus officinalis]|uniref:FAE domain-containing protein n=1 Tax=Asparagus officinalis TaxID=4686 RepID=A0A5P1F2T1_ASPOF|nr:uncharacterized protein A4U43_C04F21650 [Asparagus officinalis]
MEIAEPGVMDRERLTAEMAFKDTSIVIKIRRRLPDFLQSVKLKYVKLGFRYTRLPSVYLLLPLLAVAAALALRIETKVTVPAVDFVTALSTSAVTVFILTAYYFKRPRPVYLVDYACYKPEDKHKISNGSFFEDDGRTKAFNGQFPRLSDQNHHSIRIRRQTYLPPESQARPPRTEPWPSEAGAEAVSFGCLISLFEIHGYQSQRYVGRAHRQLAQHKPTRVSAEPMMPGVSARGGSAPRAVRAFILGEREYI